MALDTAPELAALLGAIQRQHDETVSRMYRAWTRDPQIDILSMATDPELVYSLEVVESITTYLEQR